MLQLVSCRNAYVLTACATLRKTDARFGTLRCHPIMTCTCTYTPDHLQNKQTISFFNSKNVNVDFSIVFGGFNLVFRVCIAYLPLVPTINYCFDLVRNALQSLNGNHRACQVLDIIGVSSFSSILFSIF